MLLPTPTINGNHNRAGLSEKSGDGLATKLAMIPTPQARDWRTGNKLDGKAHQRKTEQGWSVELPILVSMLPTPDAAMHKTGYMGSNREGKQVNTETALREATGGKNTGLRLQPAFAFWMMGYPEDWTLLPFLLDPNTPPEGGEKKA